MGENIVVYKGSSVVGRVLVNKCPKCGKGYLTVADMGGEYRRFCTHFSDAECLYSVIIPQQTYDWEFTNYKTKNF